jgi:hypothetical protein
MIDENGYPTEETLERIRTFDPFEEDLEEFIQYLMDNWQNGYPAEYYKKERILRLSTGGWSGCESTIRALHENFAFWTLFWYSHVRGGHYVFRDLTDRREK